MHNRKLFPILFLSLTFFACRKNDGGNDPGGDYSFSYGDSIIYMKPGAGNVVSPVTPMTGTYTAFPEGIELDEGTGAINVSKSETGLRYRITFTPAGSNKTYTTIVLLAGVNYLDAFYFLSKNDTVSKAVYNGDLNRVVPVSSGKTVFDIDLGCNKEGIAISTANGNINLMQTIRNGFFGRHPDNDSREEFELKYKIDDKSQQANQSVKIKLYYYDTMADVPEKYFELLKDREGTLLWANNTNNPTNEIISGIAGVSGIEGKARPRPPCIFIIGR
jgi:hypothetical protein